MNRRRDVALALRLGWELDRGKTGSGHLRSTQVLILSGSPGRGCAENNSMSLIRRLTRQIGVTA